jgi:hypothetical protein
MTDTDTDTEDYIMYEYDTKIYDYSLDHKPEEIFSNEPLIIINIICSCYCYDYDDFKDKKMYVYIENNERKDITYEKVFLEIDKQIFNIFQEAGKTFECNHRFIEQIGGNENNIEYDVFCGS